ncbi:T9SS type A sorting domain-containing protein, partial [Aquiflexum sp. TKW24L]|uniref:T9SS type A sorting domain-containing protein n=1 Tax=Aquiflexum sp. TKW24L TaxID=2942212 RepID=UPI0020C163FB
VRLYNRALSETEIMSLANVGGAFRTNENPTIKGGETTSSENADLDEKDAQKRNTSKVTKIFPNPVLDVINLELSGIEKDLVQISIFDMKGILLLNQEFESDNGDLLLDISQLRLKPGTHVLLVNSNGQQQVLKFLKK